MTADSHRSGAGWPVAVGAVGAALLPAMAVFALWPDPAERLDFLQLSPATDGEQVDPGPLRVAILREIYTRSQFDYDDCKDDFTTAIGEPSSERLPFYFC